MINSFHLVYYSSGLFSPWQVACVKFLATNNWSIKLNNWGNTMKTIYYRYLLSSLGTVYPISGYTISSHTFVDLSSLMLRISSMRCSCYSSGHCSSLTILSSRESQNSGRLSVQWLSNKKIKPSTNFLLQGFKERIPRQTSEAWGCWASPTLCKFHLIQE